MRTRTHKLLQVLLMLTLAVAPLRGAWAAPELPPAASAGGATHCEHMQPGEPADTAMHAGHAVTVTDPAPCNHDCDGSCCDVTCHACVHAIPTIPANSILLSGTAASIPQTRPVQPFPERPAVPLLHPPAYTRS